MLRNHFLRCKSDQCISASEPKTPFPDMVLRAYTFFVQLLQMTNIFVHIFPPTCNLLFLCHRFSHQLGPLLPPSAFVQSHVDSDLQHVNGIFRYTACCHRLNVWNHFMPLSRKADDFWIWNCWIAKWKIPCCTKTIPNIYIILDGQGFALVVAFVFCFFYVFFVFVLSHQESKKALLIHVFPISYCAVS